MSRTSYRQTLWYLPANWSPDQWASQCYAIECDRSFYCALFCVFMPRMSQCPISLRCHEDIWGSGGIDPPCLTSTLDEDEWSATHSGHFTPRERAPGTMGQESGWGPEPVWKLWRREKFIFPAPDIKPRPSSPSLYRLSYPGSTHTLIKIKFNFLQIEFWFENWLVFNVYKKLTPKARYMNWKHPTIFSISPLF
jgi:hypothetical protein